MGVQWQKLVGDTTEFALSVTFATDPHEGEYATADEGASWGSFAIWVEGKNLCAHTEAGERVEAVHWYLFPLLEWFVRNWDPLLHEERLPARNASGDAWASLDRTKFPPAAVESRPERAEAWERDWSLWWHRHALQACRQGGLFPDVVFRRWRDQIEISWGPTRLAGTPADVSFDLQEGFARVEPEGVAEALHEVIAAASEYLVAVTHGSERARQLRANVRAIRRRAVDRRLMWLAGLGSSEKGVQNGWRRVKRYLREFPDEGAALLSTDATDVVVRGSCQAALMFGSVAPDIKKADAIAIAREMVELSGLGPDEERTEFSELSRYVPLAASRVWEQGYQLAQETLDSIRVPEGTSFVDVVDALDRLGVSHGNVELSDVKLRGIAVASDHHRPGIRTNERHSANQHDYGRRFTLAHELCHVLFDRRYGAPLALGSGPWAPRDVEKRANAFAAMLLMPSELMSVAIEEEAGGRVTCADDVVKISQRLRIGFSAVLRHLENTGFLDDETRVRIEIESEARIAASQGDQP